MMPVVSDRPRLRQRLLAALETARGLPGVDAARIGIMGYCFGGLCALDLARAAPQGLRGAVSFHGLLNAPGIQPQPTITAKVLVLHGWSDPLAPPADVEAFGKEFTAAGADWQLHAYGHALHAFTVEGANSPENGMAYNAAAAGRAWASMQVFFQEVFGTV
jgi:dienelactone hydrolase